MSEAILAAQQPQGYWYPSLKDAAHVPIPETSSTALFVLGLACLVIPLCLALRPTGTLSIEE
jgi:rhamnogalacturonyl hydrolase YesR